MFGRNPGFPIDLAFDINKDSKQPVGSYVKNLRDRLTHAYQLAIEASRNVVKRKDMTSKSEVLRYRKARVLVKQVSFDGKHKLADTWEKVPSVVVDQANSEIPVCTAIREDGEGRTRILHRNLLLPVGFIREQEIPQEKPKPVPRLRTRQQKSIPVAVNRQRQTILQMNPLMNLKLSMCSDQMTVNQHSLRIQMVQHMIFPFYLGTPIPRTSKGKKWK
jgi:hypothetical protein